MLFVLPGLINLLTKLTEMKIFILCIMLFSCCAHSFSQTSAEYLHQGNAKYELEDYVGAIESYTSAIEVDPKNWEAFYLRGRAKTFLDDNEGAVEDYTLAITIKPDYAEAYLKRGFNKIRLGEKDSGCTDLKMASVLGDKEAPEAIKVFCN